MIKRMFGIALAVLVFGGVRQVRAENAPAGAFDFKGAAVGQVVSVYEAMSGQEMVVASNVKRLQATIWLEPKRPLEKAEGLKLMEKALLEQAGVVLTKLDAKRISVTYNDALPVGGPGTGQSGKAARSRTAAPQQSPAPALTPYPVHAPSKDAAPPTQKP